MVYHSLGYGSHGSAGSWNDPRNRTPPEGMVCLQASVSSEPAEFFSHHKIQDPGRTLVVRMQGRLKKLHQRAAKRTEADPQDVALQPHVLIDLESILQETANIPPPTPASHHEEHKCMHSRRSLRPKSSEHGLRMHAAKMHRDTSNRLIPPDFFRDLHAKDDMPTCAACSRAFKQRKGLRDHLLPGACPEPDKLRRIKVTEASGTSNSDLLQLQELKRCVQGSSRAHLAQVAATHMAQTLQHRCIVCGFWTPDRTKVKSHIRQAHPRDWQQLGDGSVSLCAGYTAQMIKGHPCAQERSITRKSIRLSA